MINARWYNDLAYRDRRVPASPKHPKNRAFAGAMSPWPRWPAVQRGSRSRRRRRPTAGIGGRGKMPAPAVGGERLPGARPSRGPARAVQRPPGTRFAPPSRSRPGRRGPACGLAARIRDPGLQGPYLGRWRPRAWDPGASGERPEPGSGDRPLCAPAERPHSVDRPPLQRHHVRRGRPRARGRWAGRPS